ncbi:hypothetical protein BJ878DRAFT_73646 [Calycina marina]|uniref:C2H2-type domain-containing protein n=1 Tax=Calycina marina TaxID=1763456 RepID=A0A9P7Z2X6_9HELO|nr:hypothetical protein BJ878DRAFT_73646 [Calycina marina]
MFQNYNTAYGSNHLSGADSMGPSRSSTSWEDMAMAMSTSTSTSDRRGSYESFYNAVKGEDSYGAVPLMLDPMLAFSDGNVIFDADRSAARTATSYQNMPPFSALAYNSFGHPSNHGLAINTEVAGLFNSFSTTISPQDGLVTPASLVSPYAIDSSMHMQPMFDTSPQSEYSNTSSFDHCYQSSVSSVDSVRSTFEKFPTRQQLLDQSLEASLALQRVQATTPSTSGRRRTVRKEPVMNIGIQGKAEKKCTWQGCARRFQRQEHLKRHYKTVHTNPEKHPCQFCEDDPDSKGKLFGRTDNLKSHIKLHATYRKSSRTKYHPGALAYYNTLCDQSLRKSSGNKYQVKSEPKTAEK